MKLSSLVLGLSLSLSPSCASTSDDPTPDGAPPPRAVNAEAVDDSSAERQHQEVPDPEQAFADLLAEMGVTYLAEESALEVPGWVNMQEGLIEVFACSPGGKTHEAVVVLDCVPSGLHAGLLALGLQPGTPVETGTDGEYVPPTGDGVRIDVRWSDAAGNQYSARAEDWILDATTESAMEHCAWTFAGSFLQDTGDDERTYAANYIKSLVTTYHDASSVLENPLPAGADDTVYYANRDAVPPVGTVVTVVFRAAE